MLISKNKPFLCHTECNEETITQLLSKRFFAALRMTILRIFFLIIIQIFILPNNSFCIIRINNIYIERHNVFDSTAKDWFFAAPLANSLHIVTKQYLIEDELLFKERDEIDENLLYETERNLRSTGLFTDVKVELDSINEYNSDIYIITRDRWTTNPSLLVGTGGNNSNIGGRFEELNFIGTGTRFAVEALYRSENNIQWQGIANLSLRRFLRSEFNFDAGILAHKYRTEQNMSIYKPYRTLSTKTSFGVTGFNSFGSDFLYSSDKDYELMPFYERRINGWFSNAWDKKDRVFITALAEWEDIDRGKQEFRRAFDNSGKILIAFSSISQDYIPTNKLNNYQTEDLPVGGWGSAILGKVFPIGSRGENLYYVAGQGERSYFKKNLYLFGQVTGSSGFQQSAGKYTYQEFFGLGFYRFSDDLLLAARIRQQSVWNWYALRQLILDNDAGLRGYSANNLSGDNRIISNLELRFFPDISLWFLKLSGALFYDAGSVWRQDIDLLSTRWHHSIGAGIRVHNMKATGQNSIFRIDFAYNFDKGGLGEIIFTTDQLFSVFGSHVYKIPKIFGLDFDYE